MNNSTVCQELQKVVERVRQSADFMPSWQVQKDVSRELGSEWRKKLSLFD